MSVRAKRLVGGVGFGALLALWIIGYHQSKNCGAAGNQFLVYW